MNTNENTLILFMPDCVRKNLSGIILQRLLAEGFRLRGMKMIQLDDAILREHYAHIIDLVIEGEPLFPKLSAFIQTSPVVALVLSGPGVITRVRTILGPTNSQKADKGTIRGDYGTNIMYTPPIPRKAPPWKSSASSSRRKSSTTSTDCPPNNPRFCNSGPHGSKPCGLFGTTDAIRELW